MSNDQRPRRRWWILAAVVAVVAAASGWLISGDTDSATPGVAPPPAAPLPSDPQAPSTEPACQFHWSVTPSGDHAPVSDCAGPFDRSGGRARGFAHNETGAVFAAINITLRLSATAGAAVYRPTYSEQTIGDAQSALSQLAQEQTDAHAADTRPSQWWWQISAGDPTGDLVVIDLAAATPQTTATDSFAHMSVTLQWVDGDWKVQLPRPRATMKSSVEGFTSLGVIPGIER